jgi:hypothetical protein
MCTTSTWDVRGMLLRTRVGCALLPLLAIFGHRWDLQSKTRFPWSRHEVVLYGNHALTNHVLFVYISTYFPAECYQACDSVTNQSGYRDLCTRLIFIRPCFEQQNSPTVKSIVNDVNTSWSSPKLHCKQIWTRLNVVCCITETNRNVDALC